VQYNYFFYNWRVRILGADIALMFTFYFLNLIKQLWPGIASMCSSDQNAYLYKVETKMTHVPEWSSMRIANTQMLYVFQPILSISEFSAISGGQANHMIANLGPMTWVMYVMMLASHMQCLNGSGFSVDIADLLAMVGVAGIVMIGIFELNQYDKSMILFHYIGVGMAICILAASIIQGLSLGGNNLIPPVVLTTIALVTFAIWQWISFPTEMRCFGIRCTPGMGTYEREYDDHLAERVENGNVDEDGNGVADPEFVKKLRKRINMRSIQCIALEGTAIYMVTLALAYYLFMWGNECGDGCASRWYHNQFEE